MIKIYGMPTCPYCDYVYEQIKERTDGFLSIRLTRDWRSMGEPALWRITGTGEKDADLLKRSGR